MKFISILFVNKNHYYSNCTTLSAYPDARTAHYRFYLFMLQYLNFVYEQFIDDTGCNFVAHVGCFTCITHVIQSLETT